VSAIESRDRIDSARDISPLRRPEGAMEIDTTTLSFEEQVSTIVERVRRLTLP
jgi:cytidylate kinase